MVFPPLRYGNDLFDEGGGCLALASQFGCFLRFAPKTFLELFNLLYFWYNPYK
jgi:hypothetical protein